MKIVSLGEALIDFKAKGALAFQGYVGGSPLNVVVAVSRLGQAAALATQVSSDQFGRRILDYLRENGVDTGLVLESDAPSTLAFVSESGGEVEFDFMSNGAADTLYDPQPRPVLPDEVAFVQFGSISLLTEPTASAIVDIVAAHSERATVLFDPNIRPVLIPSKEAYLENLKRWLSLSHIVKVSAQDLGWLYPDTPFEETAQSWLEHGTQAVIVTKGSSGVSLYRRGKEPVTIDTPRVQVADTVGAGDTFMGSLMVALLEGGYKDYANMDAGAWREVLRFAAAAAALNCTRAGAQPPYREELEQYLKANA